MKGFWVKTENILFYLFLLLVPTQLGKHFWPDWSLVMGVRVDYLSPVLYLVDLVWMAWAGIKLIRSWKLETRNGNKIINFQNILIAVFVVMNVLVAENKWVALYKWLRIGQWILTYVLFRFEKSNLRNKLKYIIPIWICVESVLGLAQMVKGGSMNGLWYWLGERRFDFGSIGIAQISIAGRGLIRAYGTFSHPNSLAGFLLVCLVLWGGYKKSKVRWWIVMWLGLVGVIITGSRTVWVLGIVALIVSSYELKMKNWKKIVGTTTVFAGLFILVIGLMGVNYRMSDYLGGWDSDSLAKRVNLNMVGVKMWKENFFLGVGAGNFLPKLPEYQSSSRFYWLQPIHNIFLMAGVEMGMLGIIMIIKLLIFDTNILVKKNFLVLGIVVLTGMVDHYWITLPQNIWLLVIVLGIM